MRNLILLLPLVGGLAMAAASQPADLDLPMRAQALRDAGVPAEEVKAAVVAQRDAGVKAADAAEVLGAEKESIDKGEKPLDNFGAFVQAKLAEGARGQDLAAAIHAEHAARGQGKPPDAGQPADDHGKPADPGKPDEAGKPDDPGKPTTDHGKPDDAGKPPDGDRPTGRPETTGRPDATGRGK